MNIILFLFLIVYVSATLYALRDGLLLFIMFVKCRKVKGCTKGDCPLRKYCSRIKLLPHERALFEELLEQMDEKSL